MALFLLLLAVLAHLVQFGLCLQVTPGSSCASSCLDIRREDVFDPAASSTNSSEIVCRDLEFSTNEVGRKFKSCVECLQKSEKVNETESDIHWYFYNLRFALSTCLFAVPDKPSGRFVNSPCMTEFACLPLKEPLSADKLSPDNAQTYDYCSAHGGIFGGDTPKSCTSCLQASQDQAYLSNFVTALRAGCQQKPEPGTLLSLSGTVFAKDAVEITKPAEDIRSKPGGAGATTLTTGAIVGIAVGAGLLLIGGVVLFVIYWRRQKKFDKEEEMNAFRSYGTSPDPFLPPAGGKMSASLRSYSGQGSYKDGQHMSTGEYYDKMEEEIRAGRLQYNYDPRAASRGPNSALPAHQAYIPQAMFRGPLNAHAVSHPHNHPPTHGHIRNGSADTYPMGSIQPPQPAAHPEHVRYDPSATTGLPPPPPPPGPPSKRPKVPSLVLPTTSKLRMPKKYSPPMVVVHDTTPRDQHHEVQVSQPVIPTTSRFQDTPLAGSVVYATDAHAVERTQRGQNYSEVPQSGNSLLYG